MNNRHKVRLIDGVLYDPWSPEGPAPSPETVAYGLAHLCRYGGHSRRFYSVAEHTIWCALYLAVDGDTELLASFADGIIENHAHGVFTSRLIRPERIRLALLGLVHDAPEGAGLVDMLGPVLRHEEMTPYKQAHTRCYAWLLNNWGTALPTQQESADVKAVDVGILGAEMAIRPHGTVLDGSGEDLLAWVGFDLATKHNLARGGHRQVAETWFATFTVLKGRL